MYRVLNILQPSVIRNGVYVDSDSNVQIYSTVHKVLAQREDIELWLTVPTNHAYDLEKLFPKTNFIFLEYGTNPYVYRENLDVSKILKQKYSIILNNIPEISVDLRSYYYDVPLVFFSYFLDTPTNPKTSGASFWPLQISGMLLSDVITFTSNSTKQDFIRNILKSKLLLYRFSSKPNYILDFGFSFKELDSASSIVNKKLEALIKDYKILFFPNRITKPDYTNFEVFKKAILNMKDFLLKHNCRVIIANPSTKYYDKYKLKDIFGDLYIPTDPFTREEYLYVLNNSFIVFSLFTKELYGGCANTEAIYLEKLVIMPFINEYRRRGLDIPWKFYTQPTLSNIEEVIEYLVLHPTYASFVRKIMKYAIKYTSSIELQALKLEKIIRKHGVKL